MSKKIKTLLSVVSIILCVTILSSISTEVIAGTIDKSDEDTITSPSFADIGDGTTVGNIVSEITQERDKYTKHFRLDDGTFMAVNYVVPVHYKNEKGKWVEYDNTIISDNTATPDEAAKTNYSNKNPKFSLIYYCYDLFHKYCCSVHFF